MKKTIFLFLALLFITSISTAQDLEEILNKMFETTGQLTLVKKKSMQSTGTSAQLGVETPLIIIHQRPNKLSIRMEIHGEFLVQAYDGENAWMTTPWEGRTRPQELSGLQLKTMEIQADLDGILYQYKEKGYTAELLGKEEVEGKDAFKIKLEKEGDIFHYYIDVENYLVIKQSIQTMVNKVAIESETYYSDYRETDGMLMAFKIEQRSNGRSISIITIDEIAFDLNIDENLFQMPENTIPADSLRKL